MNHILLGALSIVGTAGAYAANSQTPNIIYILADDLGYGDLGCYGSTKIETPNIDRLAAQGMLFTQHYAGCTVSAPSRSSLLTGQHTGHTPIRGNKEMKSEGQQPLSGKAYTIAEMCRDKGYTTGAFGKWGLGFPGSEGDPIKQGFGEFYGYNCQRQAHRYYPKHLWHNNKKVMLKGNDFSSRTTFAPDLIHERALEFIRENKDGQFFSYYAIIQPHAELLAPEDELLNKYRGQFEETPYVSTKKGADYGSENFSVTQYCSQNEPRATFAAMVSRVDKYVGEVMALLEELGIAENTIIMFSSDNGPHREGGADPDFFNSNGDHRGYKRDLSDGGIRVPMIASWKGTIKEGEVSQHVSAFWDVMPTLAEVIGAPTQKQSDGLSFVAELKGKKQKEHEFLFWEFSTLGSMAVRIGDWKAIRLGLNKNPNAPIALYNITTDPEEKNNVAEQHPEIVAKALEVMAREHTPSPIYQFAFEKNK